MNKSIQTFDVNVSSVDTLGEKFVVIDTDC